MVGVPASVAHGCEALDIFNTLGMDPHEVTLASFAELEAFWKRASTSLHPDRYTAAGGQAPPHTDIAALTGLVQYLRDHSDRQSTAVRIINARGRQNWRSTWQPIDVPGKWTPLASYTARKGMRPLERERRPYTLACRTRPSTGSSQRYAPYPASRQRHNSNRFREGSSENPINLSDDGSSSDNPFYVSDDDDCTGTENNASKAGEPYPVAQRYRWTQMPATHESFRYVQSLQRLRELSEQLSEVDDALGRGEGTAMVVVGMVRPRGAIVSKTFAEYVVVAVLESFDQPVRLRVASHNILGQPLPRWTNSGSTTIAPREVRTLGYFFAHFDSMTGPQLKGFLQGIMSRNQ